MASYNLINYHLQRNPTNYLLHTYLLTRFASMLRTACKFGRQGCPVPMPMPFRGCFPKAKFYDPWIGADELTALSFQPAD